MTVYIAQKSPMALAVTTGDILGEEVGTDFRGDCGCDLDASDCCLVSENSTYRLMNGHFQHIFFEDCRQVMFPLETVMHPITHRWQQDTRVTQLPGKIPGLRRHCQPPSSGTPEYGQFMSPFKPVQSVFCFL